jgi:hypothetical protein
VASACEQAAGRHKKAGISTFAQLLQNSGGQPLQPTMLLHVHVDGVLSGEDGATALREQPANGAAPAPAVPRLLLRDDSMQPGTDSVQHYVYSGFRDLFSGPSPRLGAGAHEHLITILLLRVSGLQLTCIQTSLEHMFWHNLPIVDARGSSCHCSCRLQAAAGQLPTAAYG